MPQARSLPSAWVIFVAFWIFLLAVFLTVAYINGPKYQAILTDVEAGKIQKLQFMVRGEQIGEFTSVADIKHFVTLHRHLNAYEALTWNATDCALLVSFNDGRQVTYEFHFDNKAQQALLTLARKQSWHIGGIGMGLYKEQGSDWYRWLMAKDRFGRQHDAQYYCVMY